MEQLGVLSERYALEELVASGGMGSVYRARDEVLARTVAVKILDPELAHDEIFLERFRREALAAARLTHPNIVSIYDTGSERSAEGERHYIVMEFCGGGTLEDLARAEGALEADRICAIGAAVCDALHYAHENGVIHRDVKPANILLADDGTVKVSDFGIAKAAFAGRDVTTTGSLLGTVTYISPEQARGDDPDARSDIYSLGIVLYELAVGRPPFSADTPVGTAMQHLKEPPPAPRSLRAGVSRDLENVILAALEKSPDDRPTTAAEFRARLTNGSAPSTSVIRQVQSTSAATRARRDTRHHGDASWIARVLVLVAVVVAIAVAVTWLLSTDEESPNGARNGRANGSGNTIKISEAVDFDPHGGDGEHPTEVTLAHDDNEATAWTTEDYEDPFEVLGKTGVGVVFDLGSSQDVSSVEIVTGTPGMTVEIRSGDQLDGTDENSFSLAGEASEIGATETIDVDGSGRYWLVWITRLPGGRGTGELGEVRFVGS